MHGIPTDQYITVQEKTLQFNVPVRNLGNYRDNLYRTPIRAQFTVITSVITWTFVYNSPFHIWV